jgi:hypothetical protein
MEDRWRIARCLCLELDYQLFRVDCDADGVNGSPFFARVLLLIVDSSDTGLYS